MGPPIVRCLKLAPLPWDYSADPSDVKRSVLVSFEQTRAREQAVLAFAGLKTPLPNGRGSVIACKTMPVRSLPPLTPRPGWAEPGT